jgi:hypothetical protein
MANHKHSIPIWVGTENRKFPAPTGVSIPGCAVHKLVTTPTITSWHWKNLARARILVFKTQKCSPRHKTFKKCLISM